MLGGRCRWAALAVRNNIKMPGESSPQRIVIVGAGQAAAQAIDTLRKKGHAGSITVVGDEPLPPYQRPPLSKKFLAGTFERDRLIIRHDAFYDEHNIDTRWGRKAVELDAVRRQVLLDDGIALTYDALLLATGSTPRKLALPGADLAGVHYLRNIADVDAIRSDAHESKQAVIVGGGYIGLEVAATLREMGLSVVVLEAADRVMNRVVCEPVSRFYETQHRSHGVEIELGARIESLVGTEANNRVTGVRLQGGRIVPAQIVVVGIGVAPVDELARQADLRCENGIVVDQYCRTSDPRIYAAGDCARGPNKHYGVDIRLESVDNAFEQGTTAALNMLGIATEHDKVPWFWSDQFDLKMVIVGLAQGHDEVIVRGDPATKAFSACYLKAGELIAIDTINHTKDQMAARKLIAARARPDRAKLRDDALALKDCVA
jgi:3-phenylpropionate/trans-cinnamate dioxygenase ferredoxin reductase component